MTQASTPPPVHRLLGVSVGLFLLPGLLVRGAQMDRLQALSVVAAAALLLVAPQFKSRVEVVRIRRPATSGGKPVNGLTAADFEVRDNGVLQQVRLSDAGGLNWT